MTADFDDHAATYGDEVDASMAIRGRGVEFYARRKARHLIELVGRRLGRPEDVSALDVGCGVGLTDVHLTAHLGELHGVDTSASAAAMAAERNPSGSYDKIDGSALPFADERFDLAFAICVAHHVEPSDRASFVAEITRVVRPGGLVAIFEHNPYNPLTRLNVSRCEFDDGVSLLPPRETAGLLAGAGLTDLEKRYVIFLPVDGTAGDLVDSTLRRVPVGAQYLVSGQRQPN